MTVRADKSARSEVSIKASFGWASLTIVKKLPTHRAKGLGRLTLMSTFFSPRLMSVLRLCGEPLIIRRKLDFRFAISV